MDQAESSPSQGQPERPGQSTPDAASRGRRRSRAQPPQPVPAAEPDPAALRLKHPVIAGYDGSASSRNALAYATGVSRRLACRCSSCTYAPRGSTASR